MNRARIFIKEKCMYHLGFYIKIVYHLARPILALFTIQVKHQYVISLYILYKKVKARFWGTLNTENRVLFSLESHKLEFIRQTADHIL